jgi:hypothetical protein
MQFQEKFIESAENPKETQLLQPHLAVHAHQQFSPMITYVISYQASFVHRSGE